MNRPMMASSSSRLPRSGIPMVVNRRGIPRKPIRVRQNAAPKNSLAYRPRSSIPVLIIHPGIPRKPIRVKRYPVSLRVTDSAPKESGQVPKDRKKACEDEAALPRIDTSSGKQEIFICAICLGSISRSREPYTTQCGHVFCKECLFTALAERQDCPTCQSMTHIYFLDALRRAGSVRASCKASSHRSSLARKTSISPLTKNCGPSGEARHQTELTEHGKKSDELVDIKECQPSDNQMERVHRPSLKQLGRTFIAQNVHI